MQTERIVRYPVKGLGPDYVDAITLSAGGSMPFDREYALAHAVTEFDPEQPRYLEKHHFLMLMRNPPLGALETCFDEARRGADVLFPDGNRIGCTLDEPDSHKPLLDALAELLGNKCRGGPPTIVSAADHRFFDVPQNNLSLINLESVADLSRVLDVELDPIRFRANIYVEGLAAWEETTLIGRILRCGDIRFRVAEPIKRCAATSVNPDTGDVDVNVPFLLRKHFDTLKMGIYLEVVEGGQLVKGMELEVLV